MPNALSIDRLAVDLHAAATPDRAATLARRIDDCLKRDLPGALARCQFASGGGVQRVFIDRLAIDCAVNASWADDSIAQSVAERLMVSLEARLADSPGADTGPPGIVVFHDRPDYLAAFLVQLVAGSAWRRWWFSELDGLASLGLSAAIRTLIVNEGSDGLPALARLTEESARDVLAALSSSDAARLLRWIEARSSQTPANLSRAWVLSLELSRSQSSSLDSGRESQAGAWLSVLVALERQGPGSAGRETVEMLDTLVRLRHACASGDVLAVELDTAVPRASLRALAARCGGSVGWLDHTVEGDAELTSVVASFRALVAETNAEDQSKRDGGASDDAAGDAAGDGAALRAPGTAGLAVPPAGEGIDLEPIRSVMGNQAAMPVKKAVSVLRVATRHGGALVLFDLLTRLGWPQEWRGALKHVGASDPDLAARSLALSVVARALSSGQPLSVLGDRALYLAIGCEDPAGAIRKERRYLRVLPRDGARTWRLQTWVDANARALLEALSRRLPGLSQSTPAYLRRNVLSLAATVEQRGTSVRACLGRPPLDVMLVFAGYKRGSWSLPGGPLVQVTSEEPGA